MPDTATTHVIHAPAHWRGVGVVSDLHLQSSDPETAHAWHRFLATVTPANGYDALFILGDYFELWVGDDALDATPDQSPETPFWQDCVQALATASDAVPIYMAMGNRDFLLGSRFFEATRVHALPDNTLLDWGAHRYLMAQMRAQSQAHQQAQATWFDVDETRITEETALLGATDVVHGHTHRPGTHDLSPSGTRWVLSDWDARAHPPRLEVLKLAADSGERVPL
jgi:UDP-2,3-diacylglucosamine hydrolase